MPELPEVETIARALREGGRGGVAIVGRQIATVRVLWPRTLAEPALPEFEARLPGQQVRSIGRRGKYLVIELSSDYLLIHLRMSGDLRIEMAGDGNDADLQPHDRLVIGFTDGLRMAFNDPRKFGRVWLAAHPDQVVGSLGPEPFDLAWTADAFYARLMRFSRQIKPLLLDQTFLAGLGNIYTDEALHQAGIHPLRSSNTLTYEQAQALWAAIRSVLQEGIRRNGASFDWVYRGGDFQNTFQVYQQNGNPCPICGAIIIKTTVGQRGTHYCPVCQPDFLV